MTQNNARYDLSDRLIHFFRTVDTGEGIEFPDNWGFGSIEEGLDSLSPLFLMRSAIRIGQLWATWAIRRSRRTIYGPCPAVCFTEMPIAAFVEAGLIRAAHGEAMSPYGLVLPKEQMFGLGTRPAIYGLSEDTKISEGTKGERIIDSTQLPLGEQYRYVTYNPTGLRPVDWTHEREWRWPLRNPPSLDPDDGPPEIEDLDGLKLDGPGLSQLGAIVKTSRQADQLIYDILTKIDRGNINEKHYEFVLALDAISDISDLRDRAILDAEINNARIDLSRFFSLTSNQVNELVSAFSKFVQDVEDEALEPSLGEFGGCWLWIIDNHHEMARALLKDERAFVNKEGKYLVPLYEFSDSRNLREREQMTQKLACRLKQEYNLQATYFSVLGFDDPDGFPFYNGDMLDDQKFYNINDGSDGC